MQAIALVPCLGPDGSLEMVPASSDLPAGTWVPPSPAPSWLQLPPGADAATVAPVLPGATSTPLGPSATISVNCNLSDQSPTTSPAAAPVAPGCPIGAFRLVGSAADFLKDTPATTALRFVPGAKRPDTASGHRYAAYSGARTVADFLAIHPDPQRRRADLRWDLEHGHALLLPTEALAVFSSPQMQQLHSAGATWCLLAMSSPLTWSSAAGLSPQPFWWLPSTRARTWSTVVSATWTTWRRAHPAHPQALQWLPRPGGGSMGIQPGVRPGLHGGAGFPRRRPG